MKSIRSTLIGAALPHDPPAAMDPAQLELVTRFLCAAADVAVESKGVLISPRFARRLAEHLRATMPDPSPAVDARPLEVPCG